MGHAEDHVGHPVSHGGVERWAWLFRGDGEALCAAEGDEWGVGVARGGTATYALELAV